MNEEQTAKVAAKEEVQHKIRDLQSKLNTE